MTFPLLAALLGSNDAEAKQFFASKSGKMPQDIPIEYKKKNLSDILGKEPESFSEYKNLLNSEFKKRVEQESKLSKPRPTGEILNDLDNELMEASLNKLGAKNIQDVVPKFLTAQGIPESHQQKFNQIWLEKKDPNIKGFTHPTVPKEDVEPFGTGIGTIKTDSEKEPISDNYNVYGMPLSTKMEYDPEESLVGKTWPLTKVALNPEKSNVSASTMAHELLHAIPYYKQMDDLLKKDKKFEEQDFKTVLENPELQDALKKLGFMGHFPVVKNDEELSYGLQTKAANILHPEWFKKTKEAVK